VSNQSQSQLEVAIGAIVENSYEAGPRVLICLRPKGVVLGGLWELPGGKIEPGETPAECLRREFEEELGLSIEVGRPLGPIEHVYDHAHVLLRPFLCRRLAGEPQDLQVAEHRWVGPGELADYTFPEANGRLMVELAGLMGA